MSTRVNRWTRCVSADERSRSVGSALPALAVLALLALQPTPAAGSETAVEGICEDAAHVPIAGASVTELRSGLSTTSLPDGSFQITGVPVPADGELSIRASGLAGYHAVTGLAFAASVPSGVTDVGPITLDSWGFGRDLGGSTNTTSATDVTITGGYAFVADTEQGLVIFDLADPAAPAFVAQVGSLEGAWAADVSDGVAYVVGGSFGLTIVDVSDPAVPLILGSFASIDQPVAVEVSGQYAYVADELFGLKVIDVSDPFVPVLVGSLATASRVRDLACFDHYVALANDTGAFKVVEVANPANPSIIGSLTGWRGLGVAMHSGYAIVGDNTGKVRAIDITNPMNPIVAATLTTINGGGLGDVRVVADRAYFAAGDLGLIIVGVGNPLAPTFLARCDTPDYAWGVDSVGDLAYVADRTAGLRTIDVANISAATRLGLDSAPQFPVGIAIDRGLVCVAGQSESGSGNDVVIYDCLDPNQPSDVFSMNVASSANSARAAGSLFVISHGTGGVTLIDRTTPATPFVVGALDTPGTTWDAVAVGEYLYIADGSSGLRVANVANPAAPTLVAQWDTPGTATGVCSGGNLAFVADRSRGLRVIDVTDPLTPVGIGEFDPSDDITRLAYANGYVYALGTSIHVIDVRTPSTPAQILSIAPAPFGTLLDIAVKDGVLFVAEGQSGARVFDLQDPANPTLLGYIGGPVCYSAAVGEDLCALGVSSSIGIYRQPSLDPGSPVASGVPQPQGGGGEARHLVTFPSPIEARATTSFESGAGGWARLSLHDASGRELALLCDQDVPPGRTMVGWEVNSLGLPRGMYFLRLHLGASESRAKVVLVR